uniref:SGNH hydrolase-type esterase domain-containing protein n=1 Tax=Bionectria ochroleuca TaxID=29856 RepID=A0A0B7K8M3_BIOOC
MKFLSRLLVLGLGSLSLASPVAEPAEVAELAPTLYLCGDSTMAKGNGVIDGWGQHISKYINIPVVNKAIGGRSSRSFTNEGRFTEVANLVKAGDVVVIEFGHNDVCTSGKTGEKVYTFVFYVIQAAKLFTAKGATVVLSSHTPNNLWITGSFQTGYDRFIGFQVTARDTLADPAVTFVDHYEAVVKGYKKLGNSGTNAFYPQDHKHTDAAGADFSAKAFAQAIQVKLNGTTSLFPHLKSGNPTVW